MVRAAAKNHEHVAVITDPAMYAAWPGRWRAAGSRWSSGGGWRPGPTRTPPPTTRAVASWFASVYAPDETAAGNRLAGCDGGACGPAARCSATGRTRTSGPRCTSAGGGRGGQRRRHRQRRASCTARPCPTTTTWTPRRPGGPRSTSPSRAWPSSSTPTRAASRWAPTWPRRTGKANACDPDSAFGGVIAANGVVTAAHGRPRSRTSSPRSSSRPGFEDAALDILTGKKNLRLLACPPPVRPAVDVPEWRQVDGGLLLQTAGPRSTPPAMTRPAGSSRPGSPPPRHAGRPGLRLAGHAAASSPTPSCSPPGGPRWGWAWARSTGWTRPGWRYPGGRPRGRRGRRPATRTSRSRTAWRC